MELIDHTNGAYIKTAAEYNTVPFFSVSFVHTAPEPWENGAKTLIEHVFDNVTEAISMAIAISAQPDCAHIECMEYTDIYDMDTWRKIEYR
jgi:hypothetical protein